MAGPSQQRLRLRDRRRRKRWLRFYAGVGIISLILFSSVLLMRQPEMMIRDIQISEVKSVSTHDVQIFVQNELAGNHFYLVPRANAFFAPLSHIETSIAEHFTSLASARISRIGLQGIQISIVDRLPAALYCVEEKCSFMDENGFIYGSANNVERYVQYSGTIEGNPFSKTFLEGKFPEYRNFIVRLEDVTRRTVKTVELAPNNDSIVTFRQGGALKFTWESNNDRTLENVASVFASTRLKNGDAFSYADFRFGDKAYVSFTED